MVSRDPIKSESAHHWARVATKLRRRAEPAPTDVAALALLTELDSIAHDSDYEVLLTTQAPDDLVYEVAEWLRDSEDPELRRRWKQDVERREHSIARLDAFYDSYNRCRASQYELHRDQVRVDAQLATRVLLREATHLLAEADVYEQIATLDERAQRRRDAEAGSRWRWACWTGPTTSDFLRDSTKDMAQRCVEIGTTLAGEAKVVSACFALLEELDDAPPLVELVPEPRSTTVMQHPVVVGPEFL